MAGYLEQKCAVRKGDRVLLLMQNSPQFMIGLLRHPARQRSCRAVESDEFDAGNPALPQGCGRRSTMLVSQELYPRVEPLLKSGELKHVIVAAYSDYLESADDPGGAGVHRGAAPRL